MNRTIMLAILAMPKISLAQDDCPHDFRDQEPGSVKIIELSSQYQKLRAENSACNRKWKSDLQLVMEELGTRLGKSQTHKNRILKYMGTPDLEPYSIEMIKLNDDERIIVYHWRGWHDWLYFVIRKNRVVKMNWWYAYK